MTLNQYCAAFKNLPSNIKKGLLEIVKLALQKPLKLPRRKDTLLKMQEESYYKNYYGSLPLSQ